MTGMSALKEVYLRKNEMDVILSSGRKLRHKRSSQEKQEEETTQMVEETNERHKFEDPKMDAEYVGSMYKPKEMKFSEYDSNLQLPKIKENSGPVVDIHSLMPHSFARKVDTRPRVTDICNLGITSLGYRRKVDPNGLFML